MSVNDVIGAIIIITATSIIFVVFHCCFSDSACLFTWSVCEKQTKKQTTLNLVLAVKRGRHRLEALASQAGKMAKQPCVAVYRPLFGVFSAEFRMNLRFHNVF